MAGKQIKASIIIGGGVSGAFRSALSTTKGGLTAIGDAIANVERKQRLMARGIDTFGRMGKNVDGLRQQYAALTRDADRLRAAQQRLADLQGRIERNTARRREVGGQLRGAVGTLGAVAAAAFFPVREAVRFEDAMLGVQKQLNGARDASGNLTPVFFEMGRDIQRLGREIPVATTKLADMVAAGLRMGIDSEDVLGFTRDTAKMATAFEMEEGPLADSMGKIAGIFKIPISAIGELGDAINYLDDNAIAKGSDIISVMQGDLAGAAATMGLSAKNAAALASTFLTLGESAERADTAAAGMMRQLQVAKMNPKRFQVGVKMLGLTAEGLQKGMIDDPQAMILDVLGRIKSLPVEQQMEAVTRLFGKDWGGAIAKLANGVDTYRRQLEFANGAAAKGSMSREFEARVKTMSAQWQMTKNRIGEAATVIGSALVPSITRLMQSVDPMIERFTEFSRNNPGVIKGVVGMAFAMSGLRVATLGVRFAWLSVMSPVLKAQALFAKFKAARAIAQVGGQAGKLGGALVRVGSVVRAVGAAIAAIGGGPIALAVAALTAGALLVRKYWQPIRAWIGGVFTGIAEAAGPAMSALGESLAALRPAWNQLSGAIGTAWDWVMKFLAPVQLTSQEFANATSAGEKFGRAVGGVLTFLVNRLTDVVRLIGWVVDNWGKVSAVGQMLTPGGLVSGATRLAGSAFGDRGSDAPSPAVSPLPGLARGRRAEGMPTSAPAPAKSTATVADSSTHTYHITQQPGESSEALAERIERERRRKAEADRRGSLVDVAA